MFDFNNLKKIPVVFPDFARPLHLRIAGEPGAGKTRLGAHITHQDSLRGIATIIMDGNGGLIRDLISLILAGADSERILSRFWYVSFSADRVHGLPFFDYSERLSAYDFADSVWEAMIRQLTSDYEIVATTMRDYCFKTFTALTEAARVTGIPFQATDAIVFLEDEAFRARILEAIKHLQPDVVRFFNRIYNQWSQGTQNEKSESFKTKIVPYVMNSTLRAIVGMNYPTINFAEVEENGYIVALDFSGLSDQVMFFVGTNYVNRFSRYLFSHPNRERPISLVVDEAASLLAYPGMARDFREFQGRARAFKLWMTIIHQNMHQLDPKLRQGLWSVGNQFILRLLSIEDAQEASENLLSFVPEKAKVPEGAEKPMGMAVLEQSRLQANLIQRLKDREGIFRRPKAVRNWRLGCEEVIWATDWVKVPEISLGEVTGAKIEAAKERSLATFARPKSEVLSEIDGRIKKAMSLPIGERKKRRREKA